MKDLAYFQAWSQETLARYAFDQYEQNEEYKAALDQVRQDLKSAINEARQLNKQIAQQKDDWK
jgi:hypothetical protein